MIRSTFLVGILLATSSYAQVGTALSGLVNDAATKEPLPYLSIVLTLLPDSVFESGTVSEFDGRWTLPNVKPGEHVLIVSGIGYAVVRKPVQVGTLSPFLDLGTIALQRSPTELGEVEIVGRTEAVSDHMDKKVFNLADNASQSGGTVLQAMRNLPGVTVDQRSGKLQLRGSDKVMVLIDGQQTALTGFGEQSGLDNIPASAIERIEVINDPSAKQDANGMAGIINIIYKKDKRSGLHGKVSLMGGIGALGIKQADLPTVRPQYSNTPKLGPSLGLTYNKGKLDFFLQGDLLTQKVLNRDEHFLRSYSDGSAVRQQYLENRDQTMYTLKGGFDLNLDQKNVISFSALYNLEGHIDNGDVAYFDATSNERQRLWQFYEDEVNTSVNLAAAFKHKTSRPGETLDFGANYTFHREDEKYNITDNTILGTGYNNTALIADERVTDVNLDYVRPLPRGRVELGSKFRWRTIPTRIRFDADINSPLDPGAAGGATYSEVIPAVYANYVLEQKKFELEAGLRMEYVDLNYTIDPGHNTYSSAGYSYLQPFPNARFAYKIKEGSRIQLALSRRVDRPTEGDLRIFPKYDDPGFLRIGNPGLQPQFTWRGELGYKRDLPKGYVYAAAYHRITSDILTRIVTGSESSTQLYTIAQNAGQGTNSGLELVLEHALGDEIKASLNGNIYRNAIDAFTTVNAYPRPTPYAALRQELTSGNVKLNTRYTMRKDLEIQITGIWLARDIVPQGSMDERWSVDMGVVWKPASAKSTLTLSATDILNTMRVRQTVIGEDFRIVSTNYYETRAVRLTWAWNF